MERTVLQIVDTIEQICYDQLMEVYEDSILRDAQLQYPGEDKNAARILAEQDFYAYLKEVFFPVSHGKYAFLVCDGAYVSALRWEAYEDGVLLTGVETAPSRRRRGYAAHLIHKVMSQLPASTKVYSHVEKENLPSVKLHESCGFARICNDARYLDGSTRSDAFTYRLEIKRS